MRNITLSTDGAVIDAAQVRAQLDQTTLNELRRWLAEHGPANQRLARYEQAISLFAGQLQVGGNLTRDERNER